MKKAFIIAIAAILTGCATLDRGDSQELEVQSRNNTDIAKTACTLKNEDGYWTMIPNPAEEGQLNAPSNRKIVVERDGGTLYVSCESEEQIGATQVKSRFEQRYFRQDLFSLCLFCVVDAASGAFFSYPDVIYVDMVAKKTGK